MAYIVFSKCSLNNLPSSVGNIANSIKKSAAFLFDGSLQINPPFAQQAVFTSLPKSIFASLIAFLTK